MNQNRSRMSQHHAKQAMKADLFYERVCCIVSTGKVQSIWKSLASLDLPETRLGKYLNALSTDVKDADGNPTGKRRALNHTVAAQKVLINAIPIVREHSSMTQAELNGVLAGVGITFGPCGKAIVGGIASLEQYTAFLAKRAAVRAETGYVTHFDLPKTNPRERTRQLKLQRKQKQDTILGRDLAAMAGQETNPGPPKDQVRSTSQHRQPNNRNTAQQGRKPKPKKGNKTGPPEPAGKSNATTQALKEQAAVEEKEKTEPTIAERVVIAMKAKRAKERSEELRDEAVNFLAEAGLVDEEGAVLDAEIHFYETAIKKSGKRINREIKAASSDLMEAVAESLSRSTDEDPIDGPIGKCLRKMGALAELMPDKMAGVKIPKLPQEKSPLFDDGCEAECLRTHVWYTDASGTTIPAEELTKEMIMLASEGRAIDPKPPKLPNGNFDETRTHSIVGIDTLMADPLRLYELLTPRTATHDGNPWIRSLINKRREAGNAVATHELAVDEVAAKHGNENPRKHFDAGFSIHRVCLRHVSREDDAAHPMHIRRQAEAFYESERTYGDTKTEMLADMDLCYTQRRSISYQPNDGLLTFVEVMLPPKNGRIGLGAPLIKDRTSGLFEYRSTRQNFRHTGQENRASDWKITVGAQSADTRVKRTESVVVATHCSDWFDALHARHDMWDLNPSPQPMTAVGCLLRASSWGITPLVVLECLLHPPKSNCVVNAPSAPHPPNSATSPPSLLTSARSLVGGLISKMGRSSTPAGSQSKTRTASSNGTGSRFSGVVVQQRRSSPSMVSHSFLPERRAPRPTLAEALEQRLIQLDISHTLPTVPDYPLLSYEPPQQPVSPISLKRKEDYIREMQVKMGMPLDPADDYIQEMQEKMGMLPNPSLPTPYLDAVKKQGEKKKTPEPSTAKPSHLRTLRDCCRPQAAPCLDTMLDLMETGLTTLTRSAMEPPDDDVEMTIMQVPKGQGDEMYKPPQVTTLVLTEPRPAESTSTRQPRPIFTAAQADWLNRDDTPPDSEGLGYSTVAADCHFCSIDSPTRATPSINSPPSLTELDVTCPITDSPTRRSPATTSSPSLRR